MYLYVLVFVNLTRLKIIKVLVAGSFLSGKRQKLSDESALKPSFHMIAHDRRIVENAASDVIWKRVSAI